MTKPDPHWADDADARIALDQTFLFELGMGSGLRGLNVTTVDATGRARHAYRPPVAAGTDRRERPWRQVDFSITRAELSELVRRLDDERFLRLERSYVDPSIQDGAQWIVHARTRGRDKYVYLSNAFPAPLVRIARFMCKLVDQRPHLAARSRPLTVDHDTHLWRWLQWYGGCRQDVNPVEDDEGCMPLWVTARLESRGAFPPAAHFEIVIADRSADGSVLARKTGRLGSDAVSVRQADVTLTVRYDAVDLSQHYDLEARVFTDDRTWRADPLPVITYGEPYEVLVPLEEGEGH